MIIVLSIESNNNIPMIHALRMLDIKNGTIVARPYITQPRFWGPFGRLIAYAI